MEYTLMSVSALIICIYYALEVRKLSAKGIAIISSISVFFQLIFDNLMTSLGLWSFDFSKTLGIAIPIIPLENLIFGVALTIATVASWERLARK